MNEITVWVFIVKHGDNIVKLETYGSVTKMLENESIVIGNEPKSEWWIKNKLRTNSGVYRDEKYHIQKSVLERSKMN